MPVTLRGSGQVPVQIVTANSSTQTTTTSTSFVTSSITATITPTNSANRILVLTSFSAVDTTTFQQSFYTIYRGATNLGGTAGIQKWYGNTTNPFNIPLSLLILDSPATTSATTYSVFFRSGGQSVSVGFTDTVSTITLMELAYA
jgi:hypothetical protein